MKKTHLKVAGTTVVLAISSMSFGVTIFAMDNLGTNNAGTVGDRFVSFDSANPVGTITTLGQSGVAGLGFTGLDFAGVGGLLYLVTGFGTGFTGSSLYTINTSTGAATLVGATGLASTNGIADLAWNPATGTMMAISNAGGGVAQLHSINLGTGAATTVGTITGLPAGNLVIGLSANAAGVLHVQEIATDQMFTLSGLAATATSSTIGANTNFSQGMTMDWSGNGNWYLAAIGNTPAFFSDVRLMNNATGGTTTVLGTFPNSGPGGLPQYELGDIAINPVPEPATIAALSLGAAALLRKRRR